MMFFDEEARLDTSKYKKKKKEKHFRCTRCGKKSDHLTTGKEICGLQIVPEESKWCKRCLDTAERRFLFKLAKIHEDRLDRKEKNE